MGFIYLITNKENGKQYVGKTSYTVGLRWQDHKKNFRRILDNMAIHKAMNKYGIDNFKYIEIEKITKSSLLELNI